MYIATVLTAESQKRLVDTISKFAPIPADWTIYAHHMTVEFKRAKETLAEGYFPHGIVFGMPVKLIVTAWKMDERGCAVAVEPIPDREMLRCSNPCLHITVACAPGVKAFYSNQLLEAGGATEMKENLMLDAVLAQVWDDKIIPEGTQFAIEPYPQQ